MKTLVNKNNPAIRAVAPEIETGTNGYYYIGNVGYHKDHWTLLEEEPAEDWREKRKKECPFRKADSCERYADVISECTGACSWVVDYPKLKEIQDKKKQEQQMPDSTQLIAEWEKEKAVLEQKDFRGDAERMAYNAFLDGFIKGLGYERTR